MIYLDNAATSFPKPEGVYRAMDAFARNSLANPGRAGHRLAVAAKDTLEDARFRLSRFVGGVGADRVAFALNGTDALNMAMKGTLQPGDHVVTTDLEHNSVSRPLVKLADDGIITLTRVPSDSGGTVDPDAIRAALTAKTRLVAVTHASNVLGTVQPVAEIGKLCREKGILFLVDAAQTIGVLPIDVQAMHIDLLAFPGHKGLFGPTGTGGLYVAPGVPIRAWREGGTGGDSKSPMQPAGFPEFLEGGTPNLLGIVGMIAGLDYVEEKGIEAIHRHEVELCERLRAAVADNPLIVPVGHADPARRVGTFSFRCEVMDSEALAGVLDTSFGICVRAGNHCSPYIHQAVGSYDDGLTRVSPGPFSTIEHIDTLANALTEITGG
ncbi:MAG: aminotransferase class V-fold PLP-dependent enzyme [Fimbriiglobus sp.]|nr:aminotransferase class V-fold PLP-dependent enzyme [Fimbriiglobus sp.]